LREFVIFSRVSLSGRKKGTASNREQ